MHLAFVYGAVMDWKGSLMSILLFVTLVESKVISGESWTINLGDGSNGTSFLYNWAICSAGVFVLVALILSMYLIFEHLAAYQQPEVIFLLYFY